MCSPWPLLSSPPKSSDCLRRALNTRARISTAPTAGSRRESRGCCRRPWRRSRQCIDSQRVPVVLAGRRRRVHALSRDHHGHLRSLAGDAGSVRAPRDHRDLATTIRARTSLLLYTVISARYTIAKRTRRKLPTLHGFSGEVRELQCGVASEQRHFQQLSAGRCARSCDRTCVVRRAREAGGSLPGRASNDPWNEHWKRRLAVGQPRGHRRRTRLGVDDR